MNKRFIILILVLALLLTSCSSGKFTAANYKGFPDKLSSSKLNEYIIDAKLNPDKRLLDSEEKIRYINKTNLTLKELYFHIYPNAYKRESTAPFLFGGLKTTYPSGFNPGNLSITNIHTSDNKKLKYEISGIDETILKIHLDKDLEVGESIDLILKFIVIIPIASDRFGEIDNCFNLGNWYPIAAVYDNNGWNIDPYYNIGDPFYSDVSNYTVRITIPKEYKVASTGELVEQRNIFNKSSYVYREYSVRDFAWVTSNKFKIKSSTVDGINIKCFSIKDNKSNDELALKAAEDSIKIFNNLYGKYPYKNFSVVETNFNTGMEYPQIVFISKEYYDEKKYPSLILEDVIVHETAHQWWYSTVGDDEIDEAWLDESFARYSEALFYEKRDSNKFIIDRLNLTRDSSYGDNVVLKPLSKFKDYSEYGALVYNKGAEMLNTLREKVGDDTFFKIMRTYYDIYKFKNATTKDFISIVNNATNDDWSNFFNKWLLNKD